MKSLYSYSYVNNQTIFSLHPDLIPTYIVIRSYNIQSECTPESCVYVCVCVCVCVHAPRLFTCVYIYAYEASTIAYS